MQHHATRMLHVLLLLVASTVSVTLDSVEMDSHVRVRVS